MSLASWRLVVQVVIYSPQVFDIMKMPTPASTPPIATLTPTELGGFAPGVVVAPDDAQFLCFTQAVTNAAPAPPRSTAPVRHAAWDCLSAGVPVCGAWRASRCAA